MFHPPQSLWANHEQRPKSGRIPRPGANTSGIRYCGHVHAEADTVAVPARADLGVSRPQKPLEHTQTRTEIPAQIWVVWTLAAVSQGVRALTDGSGHLRAEADTEASPLRPVFFCFLCKELGPQGGCFEPCSNARIKSGLRRRGSVVPILCRTRADSGVHY